MEVTLCGFTFQVVRWQNLESAKIWASKDSQIQIVFRSGEARSFSFDGACWVWHPWHIIPDLPEGTWEVSQK